MSTTPTLAEAIRIGAAATKPCKGEFLYPTNDHELAACAIGCVAYALGLRGYPYKHTIWSTLDNAYPEMLTMVQHPAEPAHRWNLWSVLVSLNDGHEWSREKIADWVEGLDLAPTAS